MKLAKFGMAVAVIATVLSGSLLGATPAAALTFGDSLDFTTDDDHSNNLATLTDLGGGLFSFDVGAIELDVASVFGLVGTDIADTVITLQEVAAQAGALATYQLVGTNITWLTGLNDEGATVAGDSRIYNLASFTLNRESAINSFGSFAFTAAFNGFFEPPTPGIKGLGGLGGFGGLSSDGSTISGSIAVVPTPAAVLPGLVGLGTAVFRKKKQKEENELAHLEVEAHA